MARYNPSDDQPTTSTSTTHKGNPKPGASLPPMRVRMPTQASADALTALLATVPPMRRAETLGTLLQEAMNARATTRTDLHATLAGWIKQEPSQQ